MFAAHIVQRGRIELVDSPEPDPPSQTEDGAGEIVFQPQLACLCGSDLPFFDSDEEFGPWPQELGHSLHEMIGTVVASSGRRFREGDRVLAVPVYQRGFFQRYRLDERRAIPLDDRQPPEHTLLAQPLGTVICALKKIPHWIDHDVAVVGQGPIGQMFVAALKNLGARRIIATDRLASRLEVSPRMGATHTVCNATHDPADAVSQITGGAGPDVVIEAVGHGDQALNLCVDLCPSGGRLLYFGVPPERIADVPWRQILYKNLSIQTSVEPDFERDFPLAMQWIGEGRIDLRPLLTHRYAVADAQQAFETFRDRTDGALKVLLEFPRS